MTPRPLSDPEPPSSRGSLGTAARPALSGSRPAILEVVGEASPSELLCLLVEQDPLGLEALVHGRLEERWLLLDPERVFQRAAARVTYHTVVDPPAGPEREAWLVERVDEAVADCLSIDAHGRQGAQGPTRVDEHRLFAEGFGAGNADARAASVHFHALPDRTRRTLIELLMNEKTIEECVSLGLGTREALGAELERALEAASGERARREKEQAGIGARSR